MAVSLSSQILALEEQKNNLLKKCETLQNSLDLKNIKINKLKLNLELEKFKFNLISNVIEKQFNFKIDSLLELKEDGLHINNHFENLNIPIIVEGIIGEEKSSISCKKTTNKPKSFRSVVKKNPELEAKRESKEDYERKLSKTESKTQSKEENLSIEQINSIIKNLLTEIEKNRLYKKSLLQIKNYRNKLLSRYSLKSYILYTKENIEKIEEIFKKKGYDTKKINTCLSLALTPLEMRLLKIKDYFYTEIEADNINSLKNCLKIKDCDTPNNIHNLIEWVSNYSLAVLSVKEILKEAITPNMNIIYLHLEKSKNEDRYSFYILEKIVKEKKFWKMDCRLYETSKTLAEIVSNYCISLFRQIYYDIYGDNLYRTDYKKTPACNQDCEMLILNIIFLKDIKKFNEYLRKIFFKKCLLNQTKNDKFDFTKDDSFVEKNLKEEKPFCKRELTKRLFENIKETDIDDFISKIRF